MGSNTFPHVIPVASLAEMAGLHLAELDYGTRVFVIALLQNFYLLPSAPIAANGVAVVTPVAGAAAGKAAALWVNESVVSGGGVSVTVSAKGGGLDDWPTVIGLADALAYKGSVTMIGGATPYLSKTLVELSSGVQIIGGPGVSIVSTLVDTLGVFPGNYPFHLDAPAPVQVGGTLAATPALGATTLSIAIAVKPTVGHYIQLVHGVSMVVYRVVAASGGSSPWSVTIDRPTNLPWTSAAGGDEVSEYASRPSDVTIDLGGGTISGTGNQFVQVVRSERVTVRGFVGVPDAGLPGSGYGYDVGCRDCVFEDCFADFTGADGTHGGIGAYAQSGERINMRRVKVKYPFSTGVVLFDCVNSRIDDCHVEGGGAGLVLSTLGASGTDGKTSFGCYDCIISGGSAVASSIGAAVAYAGLCKDCTIENFAAIACSGYGVYVGALSVNATIDSCDVRGSTVGLIVQAGAVGTKVKNLNADGCTGVGPAAAVSIAGDVDLDGLTSSCNIVSEGIVHLGGAGPWRLRAMVLTQQNANGYGIYITAAGEAEIDGCAIGGPAVAGLFINSAGAVVTLRNTTIATNTRGGGDQGIYVANGATLILGDNVDLSACTSPFTLIAGSLVIGHFSKSFSSVAMVAADKTATWSEYAAETLILSGTLGAGRSLILPMISIAWVVKNGADQTVTVKGASGTGVAIVAGATARVLFTGTNFVQV